MPKRKVRTWGFQRSGPYPFWGKVGAWLAQNREAGREYQEWQDLAAKLQVGASTLSEWRQAGQLPPPDWIVSWLCPRMGSSLPDLLDPNVPLGALKSADQTIKDFFEMLPPAVRETIARALRANPRAALGVLAGLDPSASLPGSPAP